MAKVIIDTDGCDLDVKWAVCAVMQCETCRKYTGAVNSMCPLKIMETYEFLEKIPFVEVRE